MLDCKAIDSNRRVIHSPEIGYFAKERTVTVSSFFSSSACGSPLPANFAPPLPAAKPYLPHPEWSEKCCFPPNFRNFCKRL